MFILSERRVFFERQGLQLYYQVYNIEGVENAQINMQWRTQPYIYIGIKRQGY